MLCAALALTASARVCSQPPNEWRLLPDSSVVAPIGDLRTALAYRRTQDRRVRMAAREVAARTSEADTLRAALLQMEAAYEREKAGADELIDAYDMIERGYRHERKVAKRARAMGWVKFGVGVGAGVLLIRVTR